MKIEIILFEAQSTYFFTIVKSSKQMQRRKPQLNAFFYHSLALGSERKLYKHQDSDYDG